MRVITGKAKGLQLESVPGDITRPITDRAKEALFDIIGNDIIGARFLDLFAGTGQVGIEALSRGAERAVFVERAPLAVQTVRENLSHTELEEPARVVQADVFRFLTRPSEQFDYVFIAPPQYHDLWIETLRALDANPDWMATYCWVIVQIHPVEYEKLELEHLMLFDQRTYGKVMLCFYIKAPEEE